MMGPDELAEDMRTDAERAEFSGVGATSYLALRTLSCSSLHTPSTSRPCRSQSPNLPLYKPPPPATDATARVNDDTGARVAHESSDIMSYMAYKVVYID